MATADRRFLTYSVFVLRDHYLPKIREAVGRLTDEEVWQRAGEATNSVGNLLLHLAGNVRQHIISGVGGAADTRNRPFEFGARAGIPKAKLLADLEHTVAEACAVLETLDPALLFEERVIQGQKTTLFDDIFHVVEHFAYHSGQIIHLAKAHTGRGFDWYRHLD